MAHLPRRYRLTWLSQHHDEVPSTQDLAIAAAQSGAPSHLAIIAARQTAGRGRENRVWRAPEGNLNLSILLRPGPVPPVPARWSLLAGLATYDAIAAQLPNPDALMLKWPNDLLLNGAKLAGILIDSALTPAGLLDWLVIGIGVNIAEAPTLPDRPTACLANQGVQTTPTEIGHALMHALDHWITQDLPTIRAAWLARAHPPGTPLRVQQAGKLIHGLFEGLSPDGSLLLRNHASALHGEVSLATDERGPHAAGG